MNEHVQPQNGWLIVCECEHPFAKSNSPLNLDAMRNNSRLQWNRVVASGWANAHPGDLVCVNSDPNTADKMFMDGDICYGSIHFTSVRHIIPKQHASHVKDLIRTPDIEVRESEQAHLSLQAALNQRAAGGLVVPGKRMIN